MKRLLFFIFVFVFTGAVYGATKTITWVNGNSVYDTTTCTVGGDVIIPQTNPTKYGYHFVAWDFRDYTTLKYIESTGSQYIDTGITPTSNFDFYLDGMITSSEIGRAIFGTSTGSIDSKVYNASGLNSGINGNYQSGGIGFGGVNNRFYIGLSPRRILNANGTERVVQRAYSPSGTFMLLNYGGATMPGKARIYGAKLYDGNNLVFDLIPVKNSAGEACMYDTVSGTYLMNAGTGSFTAGPIKIPGIYTELEYIQSSGTQYIDTGWYLPANKNNFELSVTFDAYTTSPSFAAVCGVNNSSNSGEKQYYLFQFNSDFTRLSCINGDEALGVGNWAIATGAKTATMSYSNGVTTAEYNGETKTSSNTLNYRYNTSLWLFKNHVTPSGEPYASKIRMYAFSIKVDSALVRNMIPAKRNSDNEIGMYDTVTNTFFTNQGTGDFVAGPEVQ